MKLSRLLLPMLIFVTIPGFSQTPIDKYAGTWDGAVCYRSPDPAMGAIPRFIQLKIDANGRVIFGNHAPAMAALDASNRLVVEFLTGGFRERFNLGVESGGSRLTGTLTSAESENQAARGDVILYPVTDPLDDFRKEHSNICQ